MSYIRIWVHLVFGTKNKESVLVSNIKMKLLNHIKENAKRKNIFIDEINGSKNHVHCLISLGVNQSVSKISQLIKGESSFWVNRNKIIKTKFEWADEYFAVSVSESQVDVVRKYIRNQEEHHKIKSYAEEYDDFMRKYNFRYLG